MMKKKSLSLMLFRCTIVLSLVGCMALPQSVSATPMLPARDRTCINPGEQFDWLHVDVGMGVPLKRTINDGQQDQARLHFMWSATNCPQHKKEKWQMPYSN